MSDAVPQYPRGQKVTDSSSDKYLGSEAVFQDSDLTATGVKPLLTNMAVYGRWMKNTGSALTGGTLVKFSSAPSEFSSAAGSGEVPCGVIDPDVSSVGTNERCWVIFRGPTKIRSSAAVAANLPIKTAATGEYANATGGRDETDCGRTLAASTGADEVVRCLIDCGLS